MKIAAKGSKETQQGLEPLFCRTPCRNIIDALCGEIISKFGRNRSFSTEYALNVVNVHGAAISPILSSNIVANGPKPTLVLTSPCRDAARHCGLSLQPQKQVMGEFTLSGTKPPARFHKSRSALAQQGEKSWKKDLCVLPALTLFVTPSKSVSSSGTCPLG